MPQQHHMIEEVFGPGCNLYKLLKCSADATKAQLRKGYYRAALKVHPDKNTGNDTDTTKQFQAISMAYQILQDETLRQEYDETGVIPDTNDNDGDADDMSGSNAWKSYFDQIFGKVTTSKIDSFAATYKCSDEEKRDVLREFKSRQGNLVKMLDFVMLSEPRDAIRWVEDYIRPALYGNNNDSNDDSADNDNDDDNDITDADKKEAAAWKTTMEKTLIKLQKQVEKENQKQAAAANADHDDDVDEDDDDDNSMEEDEDESETEDDNEEDDETPQKKSSKKKPASSSKSTGSSKKASSSSAKKGKPLQAKHAKKTNNTKKSNTNNNSNKQGSMDDLIAQIQNKRRGGGGSNAWADLGVRYGVANEDDNDPLNDDEFAKIQAGLGNNNKKKSKGKGKR